MNSIPAKLSHVPNNREIERYFPGLYQGKDSSSKFTPEYNIAKEVAADPERKRLFQTAVEFQSIFISQMLKSMRSMLHRDQELLYAGNQQDIFEDMLYDEYAKKMSSSSTFRLADQIYEELSRALPPLDPALLEKMPEQTLDRSLQDRSRKALENYRKNLSPSIPTERLMDFRGL